MASSTESDSAWRVATTSAVAPEPTETFMRPARFSTANGREASSVRRTVFVASAKAGAAAARAARARIEWAWRTFPSSADPVVAETSDGRPGLHPMYETNDHGGVGSLLDKYLRKEDERGLLEKKMREEGRLPPGQSATI